MPTTAQMETFLSDLGITKMVNEETNYDDEFTKFIYECLTFGMNIIVCHNDSVVCHNDSVVYLT